MAMKHTSFLGHASRHLLLPGRSGVARASTPVTLKSRGHRIDCFLEGRRETSVDISRLPSNPMRLRCIIGHKSIPTLAFIVRIFALVLLDFLCYQREESVWTGNRLSSVDCKVRSHL